MTAHRDQHGSTLHDLALALTRTDEPRENLGPAPASATARILSRLDASGDHGCGTGPTDTNSPLAQVTARYGSKAVGDAIRPEPAADGRPAHRNHRNRWPTWAGSTPRTRSSPPTPPSPTGASARPPNTTA